MECPMPNYGVYSDDFLRGFLTHKQIAILGLSPDPSKKSHEVASYLKSVGYELFPIHPKADEILGFKVYRSIFDLPCHIHTLNVFRKSEAVSEVALEAIKSTKVSCLWVQLGIQNAQAESLCKDAGIPYVENLCIAVEHKRLKNTLPSL